MLTPLLMGVADGQIKAFSQVKPSCARHRGIQNAADVLEIRHRKDHEDKETHSHQSVNEVKCYPRMRLYFPKKCFDRL